jgi:hypothetical protein
MNTVGIRVFTRQIVLRILSAFSMSTAQRHSPSVTCAVAACNICMFLDIFNKNIVTFEDTFSVRKNV